MLTSRTHAHPLRRSLAPALPRLSWKSAGALAMLCSTVAWASFPHIASVGNDDQQQWEALRLAPLSTGGGTGIAMAPNASADTLEFAPKRAPAVQPASAPVFDISMLASGPVRLHGLAADGLYWSLRAAGASPQVAAEYLAALATEIDVGEVAPSDSFDLVVGNGGQLLYAGLNRAGQSPLELVKWAANGRSQWIDAANAEQPPATESSGFIMPAQGPITSYFGYRYHPILHFTRFHAGVDIGASWGSPIVAAADGQVAAAGWAGGYGREVQIAHGGGVVSLYGHMSEIVAQPGSFVHAGQVIGYVGSSGLSTGPHVHFEVRVGGSPVNPLSVRIISRPVVDTHLADAVKARLKALLSIAVRKPSGPTAS